MTNISRTLRPNPSINQSINQSTNQSINHLTKNMVMDDCVYGSNRSTSFKVIASSFNVIGLSLTMKSFDAELKIGWGGWFGLRSSIFQKHSMIDA